MKKRFFLAILAVVMACCILPLNALAINNGDYHITWTEVPIYNGTAKTPVPIVTHNNSVLTLDTDYTSSIPDNAISVGLHNMHIYGKGAHEGMHISDSFPILPTDIADMHVSCDPTSYLGAPVTPANLTVTAPDGTTLTKDVDYQLLCKNNTNVGTADYTLVGIGNYIGSLSGQFTIVDNQSEQEFQNGLDISAGTDYALNGKEFFLNAGGTLWIQFFNTKEINDADCNGSSIYYSSGQYVRTDMAPGIYEFCYNYNIYETRSGYMYDPVTGTVRWTTVRECVGTRSVSFTIYVRGEEPIPATALVAENPIAQSSDVFYLHVRPEYAVQTIGEVTWTSGNTAVATVADGKVTVLQPGSVVITAKAGDLSATWELDFAALDITKNSKIMNYDPATGEALLVWKNERLEQDEDYTLSVHSFGESSLVEITGCNLFTGTLYYLCYSDTGYPYVCKDHLYDDNRDRVCNRCQESRQISEMAILTTPTITEYELNGTIDPTGGSIQLTFADGVTLDIPMSECQLFYDLDRIGTQSVRVKYNGDTVGYFDVTVICSHYNLSEWIVVEEATCSETGTKRRYCLDCRDEFYEDIPTTDHTLYGNFCIECGYQVETFYDVPEDIWYAEAVTWAVSKNITNGIGNNMFGPDQNCTRAQVVTFLWRAAGSPDPVSNTNPFTDVVASDWYGKAVLWAVEKGITNGMSATEFGADLTCTRAQVATFLWRSQGQPKPESTENPFIDVDTNAWYGNAVLWAVANNVTNGTSENTFSPDGTCTRGQIVTFLYRCMR